MSSNRPVCLTLHITITIIIIIIIIEGKGSPYSITELAQG